MSREIIFRAWVLKENKMVNVDTISNNKGYGGALEILIDNPSFDPNKKKWEGENRPHDSYLNHSMQVHKDRNNGDDFILLQYTGLKDKNGKEIYEGDIIKAGSNTNYEIIYVEDMAGFGFNEIVDEKGEFFYGKIRVPRPVRKSIAKEFEVIGNIYSNPELLK